MLAIISISWIIIPSIFVPCFSLAKFSIVITSFLSNHNTTVIFVPLLSLIFHLLVILISVMLRMMICLHLLLLSNIMLITAFPLLMLIFIVVVCLLVLSPFPILPFNDLIITFICGLLQSNFIISLLILCFLR